jgi:hypothetical protein
MLRPYSPEEGRVREMEIRAAVVRAARDRRDGGVPPGSSRGLSTAIAAGLRRLADRLDAGSVPGSPAPSARGVATS